MIQTVTIDVPRALVLTSNQRLHWAPRSERTRALRVMGKHAARDLHPLTGRAVVDIDIWKPQNGRYDPHNLQPTVKAISDGFTDAGLWIDDNHEHLDGPHLHHGGTNRELRGIVRFVVTIREEET